MTKLLTVEVSVHIFDTSGATLFSDVRNEFYRDAHGLLLVMDVTRRETFEILSDWVAEIKLEVGESEILREAFVLNIKPASNGCLQSCSSPRLQAQVWGVHTSLTQLYFGRLVFLGFG